MKRTSGVLLSALVLVLGTAGPARATTGTAEDINLVAFKLPDRAAIDKLQAAGADLTEYVGHNDDGSLTVRAEVTPAQQAAFEAMGYPATEVIETPADIESARAERNATLAEIHDAQANLTAPHTGKTAKALADTVVTSRADYFENYAGRFISIEARTSDGKNTSSQNPIMSAAWDSGAGTPITSGGTGNLSPFIDVYYLYHRGLFRVGAVGDGKPMPSTVRVASANGGVDTVAVKRWVSDGGHTSPAGFLQDFTTHYVDSVESFAKLRQLNTEFPNITQLIDLPYKTNGYQRKSQGIVGIATPYDGGTVLTQRRPTDPPPSVRVIDQPRAVVLTAKAYGQDGGNAVTAQLVDPGAPDRALAVAVQGSAITVSLATDAAGKLVSKAGEVVAAINADVAAAALVTASRYHAASVFDDTSVVVAGAAPTQLSDFLKAPASVPRGPQTVQALRIGSDRSGAKTGVFIYCQEHAREWVVPLVCLETAERLVRNYATDPETKAFVDNLDIFILPSVNADGADYTIYDFGSQRKNMINYCGAANDSPADRNTWGVDLNRNFTVGTIFQGYDGASANCTNEVYSGPFALSEPETRNETWLADQHPNIKLAMNVHSSGGYFMWAPGAYKLPTRETLPYASYGVNQYFEQTAATTLDRIKAYRGTAILPARTGPVADVLYSAAGNSGDEHFYNRGILGYDFEVGADRFNANGPATSVGFFPPYRNPGTGDNQTLVNEGHDEAMEFANGNYGLLESALGYERDHTPPAVSLATTAAGDGLDVAFNQSEPAEIHYTTDGSTPTASSKEYAPPGPRQKVQPIHVTGTTTFRWIATDVKKQSSVGEQTVTTGSVAGTVPATLALTLGAPASFGAFTPGLAHDYAAATTATVISTAGDATLAVSDPGHLANGAFTLPQPLRVSGVPKAYAAPVSNDVVAIGFQQAIGATDALRTGSYSRTLTFTLSTTTP